MGFPLESCARIMLNEIIDFSFEDLHTLRKVYVCLDNALALRVFETEFSRLIHLLQASGEGSVHAYLSG
jgi:O-acetyl-ADP-ribose deacetylase (regulator of RNase III)